MKAPLAILFCLILPLAVADKRTLIAEPVIERGPQSNVLGGLKPDEKILKLIETYHKTGNNWSEEEREKKLFSLPKKKVLEQLLLILESDDLLIWKHYDFNPSNASSSKNFILRCLAFYTTVTVLKKSAHQSRNFSPNY